MIKNLLVLFAISALFAIGTACSGGGGGTTGNAGSPTATNISELKIGKDTKVDPATTNFNTGENIYALAVVSNAPEGKYKMRWRMIYENVPGKNTGEDMASNTVDLEGSKQFLQVFPTQLPGEYKIEVTLSDATGKQIDAKTGVVTVKGDAVAPTGMTAPRSSDNKGSNTNN